ARPNARPERPSTGCRRPPTRSATRWTRPAPRCRRASTDRCRARLLALEWARGGSPMAWTKIPPEHHPLFLAALPDDPRVETMKLFGGMAARVNGNIFAGLFGRSTMIWLPEAERGDALALEGAAYFDPMGNGRKSDKVMLPELMMDEAD